MKLPMFTNVESYKEYLNQRIGANRKEVARLEEQLERVTAGEGKAEWLALNRIAPGYEDEFWAKHIDWCASSLRVARRAVKKFEKELASIEA